MLPRGASAVEMLALSGSQRPIDLQVEELVVAEDGVKRRPDLMADRREEPALRRAGRHGVGARRLRCDGRRLQQRVGGAAGGEVARDLRESEQGALVVPQRRQRDTGPERGAVAPDALALAGVLAALRGEPEVLLCCSVVRSAVGVKHPKMPALRLLLRPPLDQPSALAPVDDHAVAIHQEDRVVANVLRERGEGPAGHSDLSAHHHVDAGPLAPLAGIVLPLLSAAKRSGAFILLWRSCVHLLRRTGAGLLASALRLLRRIVGRHVHDAMHMQYHCAGHCVWSGSRAGARDSLPVTW